MQLFFMVKMANRMDLGRVRTTTLRKMATKDRGSSFGLQRISLILNLHVMVN